MGWREGRVETNTPKHRNPQTPQPHTHPQTPQPPNATPPRTPSPSLSLLPTVKIMTGELRPAPGGKVWRHPNLRLAYVAQHAFHHVDEHLDTTPVRYVLHR